MSTTKSPAIYVLASVLVCAYALGCSSSDTRVSDHDSDTLFIAVHTSSPVETSGVVNPFVLGARLAVSHLNAQAGPNSTPLGVVAYDPSDIISHATRLRDNPTVVGVVGHSASAETLEAAPIYSDRENDGRNALVVVTPTATNPMVTRASPWIFRVCPTDHDAASALARHAIEMEGIERASIVHRNDLYGRQYQDYFQTSFEALGGEIVTTIPYLMGTTDLNAYVRRIAESESDGLVLAGVAVAVTELFDALSTENIELTILGTDDLSEVGDNPETRELAAGIRFTTFFIPDRATSDVARRFSWEFESDYGIVPDHRAALSYDAAMLIGLAALDAGPDRERIRDWVASIGNDQPAHDGVTGLIRFDENGDAVDKQVFIAEVGR